MLEGSETEANMIRSVSGVLSARRTEQKAERNADKGGHRASSVVSF